MIISLLVEQYIEYSSPCILSFLYLYNAIMPSQACKNDNLFHCILSFLCLYNAIMPLQACKNDNLFHCILSFLCLYNAIMPSQACKNDNLFHCMSSYGGKFAVLSLHTFCHAALSCFSNTAFIDYVCNLVLSCLYPRSVSCFLKLAFYSV